jgi:hypothetical protein
MTPEQTAALSLWSPLYEDYGSARGEMRHT